MEDFNSSLKINQITEEEKLIKETYKLTLKQRKQEVQNELKKENLDLENLHYLLLLDNTNEDLLYRYMLALKNESFIINAMKRYSCFMSVKNIKKIQEELFNNRNKGFRNISFKKLFFDLLYAIYDNDKTLINTKLSTIRYIIVHSLFNNQPFDLNNMEIFYYHLCSSFMEQVEINKKKNFEEYIETINNYVKTISDVLNKYRNEDYEEEKKNLKKFLTIFFSIISLDKENNYQISQVAVILKEPLSDEEWKTIIEVEKLRFKTRFINASEEIDKLILDKNIYCDIINFKYSNGKIEIPEECYLYDYISEHNIFKKYEDKLIKFLNIILKSDLFRDLVKMIYRAENENMKYFFDEEMTVEEFWNDKIIFVPFKIKRVSGFSYKETLSIFFSFYKFQYFESDLENEIFTLGAFVRVIIHEFFGHLMISYFYFMFYANSKDKKSNYNSPRMEDQIKELNKTVLYKALGDALSNIFYNSLMEVEEKDALSEKLINKFEVILGKEYAKKLTQKLLEDKDIDRTKIKERKLSELSIKIIDLLIEFISNDFDVYTNNLTTNQIKYKEVESGNLVEFLLFNNFDQYITLKECLFILNEAAYVKTNIFKFHSEFKNLKQRKNDDFINELDQEQKIFKDLFSKYNSFYKKNKNINDDLTSPKSFRENCDENLNKKIESFKCFNFGLDKDILLEKIRACS